MDEAFLRIIDEKSSLLDGLADYIWDHPETAFTEYASAARYCEVLRAEGFTVTENLAGIATAFSGSYGSGKPVIGLLGEFDALSGLGQVSGALEPQPDGKPCGHGCGHNLLGVAALGAAIAVKEFLRTSGTPGTVIFFGCPGEEGGSGKSFMARDGVFDQLDAALTWHPEDHTGVRTLRTLANCQVRFCFDGVASHAAGAPELGRSALDAAELMNIGVQFLREHMPDSARIHYALTDSGGFSPNVVQPHAEEIYLIRGEDNHTVQELYSRICDIAAGAALMTGTKEHHIFLKACSNTVPNTALQRLLQEKLDRFAPPEPTEEDLRYARALTKGSLVGVPDADPEEPIFRGVNPYHEEEPLRCSSTDVGDVSWVCPTAQIHVATVVKGTPGHSWQMVAQGKLPLAHRRMRYTSKILGAAAAELFVRPDLLEAAWAELRRRTGPAGYQPPIPPDLRPTAMQQPR